VTGAAFFSRDPGAANVLIALFEMAQTSSPFEGPPGLRPLLDALREERPHNVYAKDYAVAFWQRAGIPVLPWSNIAAVFTERPSLLITGTTDIDDDTDRLLWLMARQLGVPSHAFLDHPANLEQRFVAGGNTHHHPDWVYVPADSYIPPLLDIGFTPTAIRVAGPLHLDRVRRIGRNSDAGPLRRSWAGEGRTVILFASECASEMRAAGRDSPYDEFLALEALLAAIADNTQLAGRTIDRDNVVVVVRPHPRDRQGKFADLMHEHDRANLIISSDGTPEQAILAADIIAGMDSQLLQEAAALGKPVCRLLTMMKSR